MKSLLKVLLLAVLVIVPVLAGPAPVAQAAFCAGIDTGDIVFIFGDGCPSGFEVACTQTICGLAGTILYIINGVLVPVLFAVAFIVFLYGVAKTYIFSMGDPDEVSQGHKLVFWGVIGFVVMISLWGLVNIVANTFLLQYTNPPALPTSYPQ
jgi:Type IV secretion system pilin